MTSNKTDTTLSSNTNTNVNDTIRHPSLTRKPAITDVPEVPMEAYLANLQLPYYNMLDEEGKKEYLNNFDALEMFVVVQDVNRELAVVKLENHFLTDFLEKNDPKLLVGLRQRRATASASLVVKNQSQRLTLTSTLSGRSSMANMQQSSSRRSLISTQHSRYTISSMRRGNTDYRLNYKAKTDMADKAGADVERRIRQIEHKAMNEVKLLNARLEELRFRKEETEETAKNFELHFMRDSRDAHFLETATEKQLERKFRKFVNNWIKCARALLGTMRLLITTLQESCTQHRSTLLTKSDLSGILGAIDFEQLKIKRAEYQKSLDDKNAHMAGLKAVTGKASLAMSEEKQEMMAIEEKSQRIENKTMEVIKAISKLEKEARYVEEENKKSNKILHQLKEQLSKYDAPSVNEYIERKDELVMLEKEEKMLQRKIYILNMKYNNVFKKCKRREEDN